MVIQHIFHLQKYHKYFFDQDQKEPRKLQLILKTLNCFHLNSCFLFYQDDSSKPAIYTLFLFPNLWLIYQFLIFYSNLVFIMSV